MEERRLIEDLVTRLTPNATVVDVEPTEREVRVTIAGTTGVVARCEVPRAAVEAASQWQEARRRLALVLKQCADRAVTPVPDGRA